MVLMLIMVVMMLVFVMIVVMLMLVMIVMMVLMLFIIVVMMLVLVLVMIMVMMLVLILIVLMFLMLIMMVVMVMMMVVMMVMGVIDLVPVLVDLGLRVLFFLFLLVVIELLVEDVLQELSLKVAPAFDRLHDHLAVELLERSRDHGRVRIQAADHLHDFLQLLLTALLGAGQKDRSRIGDLVREELAEIRRSSPRGRRRRACRRRRAR